MEAPLCEDLGCQAQMRRPGQGRQGCWRPVSDDVAMSSRSLRHLRAERSLWARTSSVNQPSGRCLLEGACLRHGTAALLPGIGSSRICVSSHLNGAGVQWNGESDSKTSPPMVVRAHVRSGCAASVLKTYERCTSLGERRRSAARAERQQSTLTIRGCWDKGEVVDSTTPLNRILSITILVLVKAPETFFPST